MGPQDVAGQDIKGKRISFDVSSSAVTGANTGGDVSTSVMQPYLAINYIIALIGIFPSRNRRAEEEEDENSKEEEQMMHRRLGADPLIGTIDMFAGNFAPRGWAMCDGQLLPIAQNTALFSILGTTYGGDGRTTFALLDLRGRVPMHHGNGPGLTPRRLGEKGGVESTTTTLPSHNHDLTAAAFTLDVIDVNDIP